MRDDDQHETPAWGGWLHASAPRSDAPPPPPPTEPVAVVPAPPEPPPSNDPVTREIVPERRRRFYLPRPSRRSAVALAAIGGVLVLALAGVAWATIDYSNEYDGKILPGAVIAGADVGGMNEAEAVAAVRTAIKPQLDRPIEITWEHRTWDTTPRSLGARSNARSAVRSALAASEETSFFEKMTHRVMGDEFDFTGDVAIKYPRQGVKGFVEGIAAGLNREPRDAEIDYSTGWVEIVEARDGREVQVGRSRFALMQALKNGGDDAQLSVESTKPEETGKDFDQILLLRIGENKLYLYEDGEITDEWTVATGQPEYPTPTGLWEVTLLRYMPTWVNPDPEGWGASMPASIPPGPGNPLGVRAINWDAPAIRFHGTSAIYSLGYNASHGCVRMANEDVIELYDKIEIGTPIVSTIVAPLKPLYSSAPDPTVVADDAGEDKPESDAGDASSGGQKDKSKRKSG